MATWHILLDAVIFRILLCAKWAAGWFLSLLDRLEWLQGEQLCFVVSLYNLAMQFSTVKYL